MIAFKSCPRCQGDVLVGLDWDFSCLQCGYEFLPEPGAIPDAGKALPEVSRETVVMLSGQEAAKLAGWVGPLRDAREVLLDSSRGCVERLKAAWRYLEPLEIEDLPSHLRPQWALLFRRATRIRAIAETSLVIADIEEAGDVGSILLCFEWLLHRNLIPAVDFSPGPDRRTSSAGRLDESAKRRLQSVNL